jgi:hypothetical protein
LASGFVVIAMPRAIAPTELPTLALRPDLVAAQLLEDAQLAAAVPHTPAADELMASYQQFGSNEVAELDNPTLGQQRRRSLHRAYQRVRDESGARAVLALRARALSLFEAALANKLRGAPVAGVFGIFPNVLSQHSATRDGIEIAPHFVIRTLYKARWNRQFDLALASDFSQVEQHAYFGWLGLHAERLPVYERRQALLGYAAAGGDHASEAQGVLAFWDRDYTRAVQCLEHAYAERPSFRVRNYLRGARVVAAQAAGTDDEPAKLSHEATVRAHDR